MAEDHLQALEDPKFTSLHLAVITIFFKNHCELFSLRE